MRVWLTRVDYALNASRAAYEAAGFEPLLAPLLEREAAESTPKAPRKTDSLIFTSRLGVEAFCKAHTGRDWPVFTVGGGSAQAARSAGFEIVTSADGNSDDLIELLSQQSASFTHISGKQAAGQITERLRALGKRAQRDIYYSTRAVRALPSDECLSADYAALYSPKAARAFQALVSEPGTLRALCISEATAAALGAMDINKIIAQSPTEAAMITALQADRDRR